METGLFVFLILASSLCVSVTGKDCTNSGSELSSHTVRSKLATTKNHTWKAEMLSLYHVNPTEESTWMDLLPRKLLSREGSGEGSEWAMLYRSLKGVGSGDLRQEGGDFLMEVSLNDVRLEPDSMYAHAQQTNLEYLLILDVDNLVWSFRKNAGLEAPGKAYGGWEAPSLELRGHFVGHYMSASAHMWASTHNDTLNEKMTSLVDALYDCLKKSTHNDTLNEKMTSLVDALYDCQKKIGTGNLSAFPTEFFDRFEVIKPVWAPYYTIPKIMAGLLDQYLYDGNSKALEMAVWMAEYFGNRVKNVIL